MTADSRCDVNEKFRLHERKLGLRENFKKE